MKNPFKNFKTKKQLREEIAFLKGQQSTPVPVLRVERDVIRVAAQIKFENDIPADFLKNKAVRKLCDQIEPFVEWNLDVTEHGNALTASICIMSRG